MSEILNYILKTGFIFYPLFLVGFLGWYFLTKVAFSVYEIKKSKKSSTSHLISAFKLTQLHNHLKSVQVLTSIAPILGLLGTVNGMVDTFETISYYGNSNPNLMADGISKALLTTQIGLTIAFPLLLGIVLCRNQLKKVENNLKLILRQQR